MTLCLDPIRDLVAHRASGETSSLSGKDRLRAIIASSVGDSKEQRELSRSSISNPMIDKNAGFRADS